MNDNYVMEEKVRYQNENGAWHTFLWKGKWLERGKNKSPGVIIGKRTKISKVDKFSSE